MEFPQLGSGETTSQMAQFSRGKDRHTALLDMHVPLAVSKKIGKDTKARLPSRLHVSGWTNHEILRELFKITNLL